MIEFGASCGPGLGAGLRSVRLRALALALLLCPGLVLGQAAAPAGGSAPLDQERLDRRLLSVGKLLEQSSLARQIEASDRAPALERRAQALAVYREALQARAARDDELAARLATQASTLMFEAVRLAGSEPGADDRWRADFASRRDGVMSMLSAQQRIGAEKGDAVSVDETRRGISALVAEADRLAAASQRQQAEATLNKAYLLARAAVTSLRRGDTLVRSLNFATAQEEYAYELDRNDAHLMLVESLAAQSAAATPPAAMIKGFVAKATELRREAELQSRDGDHAAAVKRLEESTHQLVRAIRSLGIFIPE